MGGVKSIYKCFLREKIGGYLQVLFNRLKFNVNWCRVKSRWDKVMGGVKSRWGKIGWGKIKGGVK